MTIGASGSRGNSLVANRYDQEIKALTSERAEIGSFS